MTTLKKLVCVIGTVCLLAAIAMLAAGCNPDPTTPPTTATKPAPDTVEYSVTVRTAGGIRLNDDVRVYVYKADGDLLDTAYNMSLDAEGKCAFFAPESSDYTVVLEDIPAGYDVQSQYAMGENNHLEIVLNSAPIPGEVPAGTVYNPGDIIHDYTFTDIDGNQHKISDILKEKEAVVLNFWYVTCSFCIKEFPHLQEAYEMYSDKVEVLALDTERGDTEFDIRAVVNNLGLTFPVVKTDMLHPSTVKSTGYPTTVIIDRYGMISFVTSDNLTEDPASFRALLRHFSAEDYQQGVVEGTAAAVSDLVKLEDIPYGTKKYPYDVGIVEFVGEVRAGETVYYNMRRTAKLRIEDPDVCMVLNGEKIYPVNGVLEVKIVVEDMYEGVPFSLETTGGVDREVTLIPSALEGGSENPIVLPLGPVTIPVNGQDAYYTYTAEQNGVFTITINALPEGVICGVNLMNLRTSAVSEEVIDPETGAITYSVEVEAGDTLRIILGARSDTATDIEIQALASISEDGGSGSSTDNAYSVTVRDENGQLVPGVVLNVQVGEQQLSFTTGEDGVAQMQIDSGTYMVNLVVPDGYFAEEVYLLTPASRTLEIVLINARQYTVQINGVVLTEAVTVKIFSGPDLQTLICSGLLDENGAFCFDYGYLGDFVAVLEGLPSSVYVQSYYPLNGELTQIELVQTSVDDINAANQIYALGDKIHDFSITTPDGRVYNLQELLQEKKAVVLTFWHTKDAPSVVAFRYMEEAYRKYAKDLEILAMNPLDKSDVSIAEFQGNNDFSFPMAQCSTEWEKAFRLTLYPTMVIIDREGTVCLVHAGAITDADTLDAVLSHYVAADYTKTVVESIEQLVPQVGQPNGSQETPYIIPQGTTELTTTLKAGTQAYYVVEQQETLLLRVEGSDAYVIYNGQTYNAVDGAVEVVIVLGEEGAAPATVIIGNGGEVDAQFAVSLTVLSAG